MAGREARGKAVQAQDEQRRLSKEEFLQPRIHETDLQIVGFEGGYIRVRSLSVRQRRELREAAGFQTDNWDEDKFTRLMIRESIIDPQLTDKDVEEFEEMNMVLYDQLVAELTVFNMVGKAEEVKKDSKKTKSSDSVSVSPNGSVWPLLT